AASSPPAIVGARRATGISSGANGMSPKSSSAGSGGGGAVGTCSASYTSSVGPSDAGGGGGRAPPAWFGSGIVNSFLHDGQRARRPTALSGAFNECPHCG